MKKICLVLLAAVMITACKKENSPVKVTTPEPVVSTPKTKKLDATLSFSGYTWVINAPAG